MLTIPILLQNRSSTSCISIRMACVNREFTTQNDRQVVVPPEISIGEKPYMCLVCCKLLSVDKGEHQVSVYAPCVNYACCCGKICEQIYFHIQAFVQGFILGKLLCTCIYKLSSCSQSTEQPHSAADGHETLVPELAETSLVSPNDISPCSPKLVSAASGSAASALPLSFAEQVLSTTNSPVFLDSPSKHSRSEYLSCGHSQNHKNCGSGIDAAQTSVDSFLSCKSAPAKESVNCLKVKRTTVTCSECEMEFSCLVHLKQHIKRCHNQKTMVCRICRKFFSGQRGLSIHMQVKHAGEKPAECGTCGQRFFSSDECSRHQSRDHGMERGVCHICGKHFRSRHSLNDHIKVHMGIKGYVCEHCGKSFVRYTALWNHKKYLHCCTMCAKELVSGRCPAHPTVTQAKERSSHKTVVTNLLQCIECEEMMESVDALEQHRKVHDQQRPFHCQVCGKGYHTSASLYSHSKQHQEKQFHCDLCDKTFTYKGNMKKHRETHTDGQPYQCDICSKTFRIKENLKKHKDCTHTQMRCYTCHICGKSLTRLQHLKSHIKKMHPAS